MPWVILTAKLPVKPSPPKLSIHYAAPWPIIGDIAKRQKDWYGPKAERQQWEDFMGDTDEDAEYFIDHFGKAEPNVNLAMRINYKGEDIRVWKHEYNFLTPEKMRDYIFGMVGEEIPSHELVANSEADALLLRTALNTDLRGLYDSALLDGCTPEMAKAVAMGIPIEDVAIEFPQIGWYRCKPEFAAYYCYENEMEE